MSVSTILDQAGSAAYGVELPGSPVFLWIPLFAELNSNTSDFCWGIFGLACAIYSFTFGFAEEPVKRSGRVLWFRGFSVAGGEVAAVMLYLHVPCQCCSSFGRLVLLWVFPKKRRRKKNADLNRKKFQFPKPGVKKLSSESLSFFLFVKAANPVLVASAAAVWL